MYLDVTFNDGTVTHIVLSNSHTVRVINPQDQVQDAFSLDGVASISLNAAGAPEATSPVPDPHVGAAEGATEPDPTQETGDGSGTPSGSETEATQSGDGSSQPDAPPA